MRNKLVVFGLIVLLVLQTLSPAFAYAQGTTESTTNSTEQKETVASSTKPSAATSAPSSSSNNEDKTAEKSSSTDSVEASKATVESESKEQPKKQARAAITDNIFSSVKMYKINGDEVQPNDTLPNMTGIKLALQFSFTNKNY
ncbi:hypothetical protein [Enterococcus avium]|nr:hypothetical protein [Enterococcus avium]MDO7797493.1 hypothetical protein [Enterococcus avium]MDT2547092.1 hypothetical protein [Enterococcus avium]